MRESYRSGLRDLDAQLPVLPGTILEIYGEPDSGKTALGLWYCRTLLQDDENAMIGWAYTEAPITPAHLSWAGLDMSRCVIAPPKGLLNGLELARVMVEEGVNLVVLDSVAGLVATNTAETQFQRLTSILAQSLGTLVKAAKKTGALVLLLNQERRDRSRIYHSGASRTLNRRVDTRIRLRTGEGLYRAAQQIGCRVHFEITDCLVDGAPRTGRFNLSYDQGLSDLRRLSVVLPGKIPVELEV